jgi:hypothetical protein
MQYPPSSIALSKRNTMGKIMDAAPSSFRILPGCYSLLFAWKILHKEQSCDGLADGPRLELFTGHQPLEVGQDLGGFR